MPFSKRDPAYSRIAGREDLGTIQRDFANPKPASRLAQTQLVFNQVLLLDDGEKTKIGTPTVSGAEVKAEVLEQGRGKKITVLKYKSKTRYRVKRGHRQPYTKIKILAISDI